MSKAFTKEDAEEPARTGRPRSNSGLPPGAVNYLSAEGARRLADKMATSSPDEPASALTELLRRATIVPDPAQSPDRALFGTRVTLREGDMVQSYSIVGIDEVSLYPDGITWVSPLAKTLLGTKIGEKVRLDGHYMEVVEITPLERSKS